MNNPGEPNYVWMIVPDRSPLVFRNCSKCGSRQYFASSSMFRVNRQRLRLDFWLIYKCTVCSSTWNYSVLSRVNPTAIDSATLNGFFQNDSKLAFHYAVDAAMLKRNKADYEHTVPCSLRGPDLTSKDIGGAQISVTVKSEYPVHVRLDRLLANKLGLSRPRCFPSLIWI